MNYCNNEEAVQETIAEIEAVGGTAVSFKGNMMKPEDVDGMIAASQAAFGDMIDVLVNVTGGLVERKGLDEMDIKFFEHVMGLNVTSTFLATKAAAAHMKKDGSIMNFASLAGRDGGGPGAMADATAYLASDEASFITGNNIDINDGLFFF